MKMKSLTLEQQLKQRKSREKDKEFCNMQISSFDEIFSTFVVYALRGIFILIALVAIGQLLFNMIFKPSILNVELILIYLGLVIGLYYGIKKNIKIGTMFRIIFLVGLILRVIWTFSVENMPVSDFEQVYKASIQVTNGDYSTMMGTAYFGRFPHLIMFVLYFAGMISCFGENTLLVIKIINIIFSTSTILFIYLLLQQVFKDYKRVIVGTFISAVMPASILYTPVYCTENLAIPFYLASIYCFILVMNKKKKDSFLLISGFLLLIGHLFRMVAQIMVIAYIMYILIYVVRNNLEKFKQIIYILILFIIPLIIISNLLISLGVTDRKLWNGSEPVITSILKGSNIEHYGKWNEEDAKFISENLNNRRYLEEKSKSIIVDRYSNTSPLKLISFILVKTTLQWSTGDNEATFWSEKNVPKEKVKIDIENDGSVWYQAFYVVILILIVKGLFNKREYMSNKIINIFNLIFCGYGITFLILETQGRYAFIISWIFVILPLSAISINKKVELTK